MTRDDHLTVQETRGYSVFPFAQSENSKEGLDGVPGPRFCSGPGWDLLESRL